MAARTYADIIRMAEGDFKKSPPRVDDKSTDWLRTQIDAIGTSLKGPGWNAYERLMLDHERKAYREEIARRESQP